MKIICILSGGLDSTTLLYRLKASGYEIKAISFNYGQRHRKELIMANKTCEKLKIDHKIVDLTSIKDLLSNSSLTSDIEVPEGHYEDESMKKTVVPNRNMIMASIAIGYAINIDFDTIALGVHSGDHAIYPDCRPEFIMALRKIAACCDYKTIQILSPYLRSNKTNIVKDGIKLKVDYALTWTCYKGDIKPCGKCGSCQERAEAFKLNGIKDPLL
jgi:7-cyano-7-deazaguanine synthase